MVFFSELPPSILFQEFVNGCVLFLDPGLQFGQVLFLLDDDADPLLFRSFLALHLIQPHLFLQSGLLLLLALLLLSFLLPLLFLFQFVQLLLGQFGSRFGSHFSLI